MSIAPQDQLDMFGQTGKPFKSNLLRWAGSKAQSIEQIAPYLDFSKTYFEPFCGSAALFFAFQPKHYFLNDLNTKLISFYQHLAEQPYDVWKWYYDQEISEDNYYRIRKEYNGQACSGLQASMFLYLNHFGFNGIYRTNSSGHLNTPFGAKSKPKRKLNYDEISWFSERLEPKRMLNLDFEEAVRTIQPRNFCIYFDPPYYTSEERVFSEYGAVTFGLSDLERLKVLAEEVSKENLIVISYKDCSEFNELFGEHISGSQTVLRNIGGFSSSRRKEKELIAVLGGR